MASVQSHYLVLESGMTHLGDNPGALPGNFEGDLYWKLFNLPDNVDPREYAVLQCRTYNNQQDTKHLLLNLKRIGNILETHPNNPDEWMTDIAIVPRDTLKPGLNGVHIGFRRCGDDFVFDNLVLWYKTREESVVQPQQVQEEWLNELNAFTEKLKIETQQLRESEAK